jgi:pre-mRNA-splicing factor 38B
MEIQTSGRPIEVLMEKVLSMNITSSDYFKELYKIKTYHEVIDEIYHQVDHVEPWMTGNCRGPSTAFCLLYKLFTMKLTVNQMHGLLKHPDSPYIRAVSKDFSVLALVMFIGKLFSRLQTATYIMFIFIFSLG